MAPLLYRCNCCRMHPDIPCSRAICAGSRCRCNLLTLQGGLLPVRTADRGVKIGCDILNRASRPKSVIRKNGGLENVPYCLRDHLRDNDQERRIVVRKRNKRTSLIRQVQEALGAQLAIGVSKRNDRLSGCQASRIYSWETYRVYLRHSCDFVRWAKDQHGVRSLEEAKWYAAEYIQVLTAAGYAPSTLKLIAAAVAKTYRCSVDDLGIRTAPRRRADITRSRGRKASDVHFSEERNCDLVGFCRGTGLRNRKELQVVRGSQLEHREDGYYLVHIKGKGGKYRDVPVLPEFEATVVRCCLAAGDGKVWPHVSSHADIHSYRADYASTWYKRLARSVCALPKSERYVCRRDRAGVIYDKTAMQQVSRYLGHNRISVIAGHYLHD